MSVRTPLPGRLTASRSLAAAGIAGSVTGGTALAALAMLQASPWLGFGALSAGLATVALHGAWRERRGLRAAASRLEALAGHPGAPGVSYRRLDAAIGAVEAQFGELEARFTQRHSVTGLPTREPLLAAMADGGTGVVGVITFVDFDRMCAFDAGLGERAMVALVDRMTRMIGRGRMLAQVDRAQFAVLFTGTVAADAARAELDALVYALGDRIDSDGLQMQPQVRAGFARFAKDADSPPAALTRALAAARAGGGDAGAQPANPVAAARDSFALEQDLREAVLRGQLELHFQPLIDSGSVRVAGAEALLRWRHPEHGLISPAQFVPLVERIGMADEIGLWALNAACREAARWRAAGLDGLTVAVNASGHQLDRADMLALVQRTLARHALPPGCLEIELTETVAADDVERAARLFGDLRAAGVRIAIDDFGTGYSSLSALRRLAFDKIKIDREFVSHVDTRKDSQAICQSIVALARGLGIRVLAEGVERAEEYRWLRTHGCSYFQGFHFSRPLAGDDFVAFAGDRAALGHLCRIDPSALRAHIQQRLSA